MRTFEHTNRPLAPEERDRYLSEQASIGRMGGGEPVPTTAAELDDYVADMRPKLSVNAQTREFVDFLLTSPFFPTLPDALDRQLHRFAVFAGMSRAPHWARELIGFDRPSALDAGGSSNRRCRLDARRLRWAFGTPRFVEMATARARGPPCRMRAAVPTRVSVIDTQLIAVVGGDRRGRRRRGGRPDQSTHPRRGARPRLQPLGCNGSRSRTSSVGRGVSRMTVYRRYPRRDDLVAALVRRETQRFLGAVTDAIDAAEDPQRRRGGGVHRRGALRPRASDAAACRGRPTPPPSAIGRSCSTWARPSSPTTFTGTGQGGRRNRCGGSPTCSRDCSSPMSRHRPPIRTSATTPTCGDSPMTS